MTDESIETYGARVTWGRIRELRPGDKLVVTRFSVGNEGEEHISFFVERKSGLDALTERLQREIEKPLRLKRGS